MHHRTTQTCHSEERSDVGISGRQLRFRRWLSHDPAGYCAIATAPAEPRNDKLGGLLHPEGRSDKLASAFLPCHCGARSALGSPFGRAVTEGD